MWNNSGWDTVGALAAETICPQKTYPRAMFITTILVIFTYLIPIMITICLDTNWNSWEDGDFETFAYEIGRHRFDFDLVDLSAYSIATSHRRNATDAVVHHWSNRLLSWYLQRFAQHVISFDALHVKNGHAALHLWCGAQGIFGKDYPSQQIILHVDTAMGYTVVCNHLQWHLYQHYGDHSLQRPSRDLRHW